MNDLSEIVKRRLPPGVIIVALDDTLLHANRQALNMVPGLEQGCVPEEILRLCGRLRQGGGSGGGDDPEWVLLPVGGAGDCSARAFFLGDPGNNDPPTHIMVLLERIVERRAVAMERWVRQFDLSAREVEVLKQLCQGYSNREIAEALFISEFTVKDHLKHIMKKMKVASRSEIVALLK